MSLKPLFRRDIMALTNNPYYDNLCALQKLKKGPLSQYLDGFAMRLYERGYRQGTGQGFVRCIGCLSQWLEQRGCKDYELDERKLLDYLESIKHRKGVHIRRSPYFLFLFYLREMGIAKQPQPMNAITGIVNEYIDYLRQERGLEESTLVRRHIDPCRFLEDRFRKKPVVLSQLKAKDFIQYIQNHANGCSITYRFKMVFILKDFCRFLYLYKHIRDDIAPSIPRTPCRTPRLPNYLRRSDVERILKTCERKTPKGIRNYAILLLLIRLGLRAGEVRNLTLDDIDWRTGEITICGKGCKYNRLPLPQEVGKALVQYLRYCRPQCSSRYLFIHLRAPYTKIQGSSPIGGIVRQAIKRIGLNPPHKGAHVLRHTFATHLLHRGASLTEIGKMLGHGSLNSTLIYAHIDFKKLKKVAQPWPGGE
jgi:site-specific recombinase XerD